MFDFVGQKKWDAWHDLEGFPQDSAGMAYVYLSSQLVGGGGRGGGAEAEGMASSNSSEPSEESGMMRGVSTFVDAEG